MDKGYNMVTKEITVTDEEAVKINEALMYLADILQKYKLGQLRHLDEANMRYLEVFIVPVKPTHYSS